eukprot:6485762-Amphidinium_carterae.1
MATQVVGSGSSEWIASLMIKLLRRIDISCLNSTSFSFLQADALRLFARAISASMIAAGMIVFSVYSSARDFALR